MCDKPKFCVDCAHFQKDDFPWPKVQRLNAFKYGICTRANNEATPIFLVSGISQKGASHATTQRESYGDCKPEAIHFQPKPATKFPVGLTLWERIRYIFCNKQS